MQNKDDKIDETFRDKLGNYEVTPPPEIWERVLKSMDKKRKKRRAIVIWTMSGAASLTLAFLMGWFFAGRTEKGQLTAGLNNPETKIILSAPVGQKATIHLKHPHIAQFDKSAGFVRYSNQADTICNKSRAIFRPMSPVDPLPLLCNGVNNQLTGIKNAALSTEDRKIIETNLLAMNEGKKEKSKNKRWSIGIEASPVSTFDRLNLTDEQYDAVSTNTDQTEVEADYSTTLSGGISVNYEASQRLSFVSGIRYNEISQNAGDIAISYAGHNWLTSGIDYAGADASDETANSVSNDVILNTPLGQAEVTLPDGVQLASVNEYDLSIEATQNYDFTIAARYIEVPFLMRYQLFEKIVGFNVTGGFNANILVQNNAVLKNQNEVIATTTIEGLRTFVFSSSIGIGIDYHIFKKLRLNVEPTLTINLNSLNSQQSYDVRPYSVGIFSGLLYRF